MIIVETGEKAIGGITKPQSTVETGDKAIGGITKPQSKSEEIMASKLHLLQSKVAKASNLVSKHGCSYYNQLMEQNKQYIQEPPMVEKCQNLANQVFYTRFARLYIYSFLKL
ncbi:hypothetical protein ACSBR2_035422 [Camellia fascicularis]